MEYIVPLILLTISFLLGYAFGISKMRKDYISLINERDELRERLEIAQSNDYRDNRGRYAKRPD